MLLCKLHLLTHNQLSSLRVVNLFKYWWLKAITLIGDLLILKNVLNQDIQQSYKSHWKIQY